jgi:hypothetical protein
MAAKANESNQRAGGGGRDADKASDADARVNEATGEEVQAPEATRKEAAAAEREQAAAGKPKPAATKRSEARAAAKRKPARSRASLKGSRRASRAAADTEKKPRGRRDADPSEEREPESPDADVAEEETGAEEPEPRESRGFATETPVIPKHPPRTTEYVVTVDNRTGLAFRIERLDAETGERREISAGEYTLIYPFGRPPDPLARKRAREASSGFSEGANGGEEGNGDSTLLEAYYRGVADYLKTLSRGW